MVSPNTPCWKPYFTYYPASIPPLFCCRFFDRFPESGGHSTSISTPWEQLTAGSPENRWKGW